MKAQSDSLPAGQYSDFRFCSRMLIVLALTLFSAGPAAGTTYTLGTTALVEGRTAGSDSVVLGVSPSNGVWTATANVDWLHLSAANQNGTGSTNLIFSYDANAGTTRTGTLTIGDQTLTVTQTGSNYWPVTLPTTVANVISYGIAVDSAGNLYIGDYSGSQIKKWTPTNNALTTLVSLGPNNNPLNLAVNSGGDVYIVDQAGSTSSVKMWNAANSNLATLNVPGWLQPSGVALDAAGNVYVSCQDNTIKEGTNTLITLGSSPSNTPFDLALDSAGNIYVVEFGSIEKWDAANNTLTNLVSGSYSGVAVDGEGNVYFADSSNNAIKKWMAANGNVTTLFFEGLNNPSSVAVDHAGNVYFADSGNDAIRELPHAFVDLTSKLESADAGTDSLPPVLPTSVNLRPPFVPTSNEPWLTINGVTNGVVSFSFTANTGTSNRTANITVLGRRISVTQSAPMIFLGAPILDNGTFQFSFSNNTGASFTVLSSTNLSLPLTNWTEVGVATNSTPGLFQFSTPISTNHTEMFYRVRLP